MSIILKCRSSGLTKIEVKCGENVTKINRDSLLEIYCDRVKEYDVGLLDNLSEDHADIVKYNGAFILFDNCSQYGTNVNGVDLSPNLGVKINLGDILLLGGQFGFGVEFVVAGDVDDEAMLLRPLLERNDNGNVIGVRKSLVGTNKVSDYTPSKKMDELGPSAEFLVVTLNESISDSGVASERAFKKEFADNQDRFFEDSVAQDCILQHIYEKSNLFVLSYLMEEGENRYDKDFLKTAMKSLCDHIDRKKMQPKEESEFVRMTMEAICFSIDWDVFLNDEASLVKFINDYCITPSAEECKVCSFLISHVKTNHKDMANAMVKEVGVNEKYYNFHCQVLVGNSVL